MNYYLEMYRSNISLIKEFWNHLVSEDTDLAVRVMLWTIIGVSLISVVQVIMMSNDNHDPRYGTVSFWFTLSICTLGIAAIVIKCCDALMKSPRVHKRPNTQWTYLFLPTCTSLLCYFLYQTKLVPSLNGNRILPELAGVIVFTYLIFENLLTCSNKSINFEVPDSPKVNSLLGIISSSAGKRGHALSRASIVYEFRGDQIQLKRISSKELTQYLLLKEEDADCIYKEYLRYDGSTFRVAELENLFIPKLYDCLAGLLIWLMVTTPYFSGVLEHINSLLW